MRFIYERGRGRRRVMHLCGPENAAPERHWPCPRCGADGILRDCLCTAPERSPADDDLAGLAHDLCAAMEAGADPEGLRGLLVARGWRPPGEARPIDRDALRARVAVIIADAHPSTLAKADAVLDLLA